MQEKMRTLALWLIVVTLSCPDLSGQVLKNDGLFEVNSPLLFLVFLVGLAGSLYVVAGVFKGAMRKPLSLVYPELGDRGDV